MKCKYQHISLFYHLCSLNYLLALSMSTSFIDLLTLIFILLDNKIPDSSIINIIDIYILHCVNGTAAHQLENH